MDTRTLTAFAMGIGVLAFGVAVIGVVLGIAAWRRAAPAAVTPEFEEDDAPAEPRHALREELPPFGPPMIDDLTLRDWAIFTWKTRIPESNEYGQGVWTNIVDDFYPDAASRAVVLPYFERFLNDPEGLAALKKKFLATALIFAHIGIDQRAADALAAKHAHLGITAAAYDETCNAFADTLLTYDVPEDAIVQLMPMLRYLRKRLVTA